MTIFASSEDFFQTKIYINLSSQGDKREKTMVIQKFYRFSTNTKLNAKSFSIPLNGCAFVICIIIFLNKVLHNILVLFYFRFISINLWT